MDPHDDPSSAGGDDARRAGRREANLRALNSRIAESQRGLAVMLESPLTVLCECALEDCSESIEISHEQFDRIHRESTRFIVADGHVIHDVEHVVERGDGWLVVEKRGDAAREARRILE